MNKCPKCSNKMKNEYSCTLCGYDCRKDFVQLRTLYPVPKSDVQEYLIHTQSQQDHEQIIEDKVNEENFKQKKNIKDVERKRLLGMILVILTCIRLILSLLSNMTYDLAQIVFNVALFGVAVAFLVLLVTAIVFAIRLLKKKSIKKIRYVIIIAAIVFLFCFLLGDMSSAVINYYDLICDYNVWNSSVL